MSRVCVDVMPVPIAVDADVDVALLRLHACMLSSTCV